MKIICADQAAALVPSGATVACAGFVGAGHAEAITSALERRFLASAQPRDLTLVYSAGQGDRGQRGVNHFGQPGMTRVVCGGHWRSAPRLGALALQEQCEGYNLPQGVISHLYRAIAAGKPGVLIRISRSIQSLPASLVCSNSRLDPVEVGQLAQALWILAQAYPGIAQRLIEFLQISIDPIAQVALAQLAPQQFGRVELGRIRRQV